MSPQKRKQPITLYFFSNGRPYRQPYRLVGDQGKLDNYEMIEKTKRGELVFGNQSVYTMTGRPVCQLTNVKNDDAFVLVPCGHCYKQAAYMRVFSEFMRAKANCEKQLQSKCSKYGSEEPPRIRNKSLDRGSSKSSFTSDHSHVSRTRSDSHSKRMKKKKSTGCCPCCTKKKRDKSRSKSRDDFYRGRCVCENCGHNCKGFRLYNEVYLVF